MLAPGPAAAEVRSPVDIPTRPGVTQRVLVLGPEIPRATVVLFAGGHGGLRISADGRPAWGRGNFLVRTRTMFASHGLRVIVMDAPSDRQQPPHLSGFRQTPQHVADVKAVLAWARQQAAVPVWLVGTSRGTQSVAYVATELATSEGGPDGIVLSSTVLTDRSTRRAVPDMPLERIMVPVLVVHHRQDGCPVCKFADVLRLMKKLTAPARKELLAFDGGVNEGDPCQARAYHGYHGIEREVVAAMAGWITRPR